MVAPTGEAALGAALTRVTRARKKMAALANMMKEMLGQGGECLDYRDGERSEGVV